MTETLKEILEIARMRLLDSQIVDENPHRSRRTERYDLEDKSTGVKHRVFVKSGLDDDLLREINLYAGLMVSGVDPVPRLLGYKADSTRQYLVLEWLDGRTPQFTDEDDVRLVFDTLGSWSSELAERLDRYLSGELSEIRAAGDPDVERYLVDFLNSGTSGGKITQLLSEVAGMVDTDNELLIDAGGNRLVEILARLTPTMVDEIVTLIMSMPVTLDTGDISIHNVFLGNESQSVVFFDFEFASVRPISLGLELLGERFGSVPQGDLAGVAIDAYLGGWNRAGRRLISKQEFVKSHACARFHFACKELLGSLRRAKSRPAAYEKYLGYAKEEATVVQQTFERLSFH